ncbi:MAG: Hsp33 family molecular chaperone HslO [Eubacteriales bacterium]|nr:Hsp33 family molecular chaperone HslO [Eubacteriales bacterium]
MATIDRVITGDKSIRAFFARTTDMAETARQMHGLNPVACAALGRLLTCGSIMGLMMKSPDDLLTVKMDGDGPMGGLLVTAGADGHVKGYVYRNDFQGYARPDGKLDVGGALGNGTLTVMKDLGLKEPYHSTTPLLTGEIGDDMTYYFATSEQTPSAVGAGVLMDREDASVRVAGGFIVQLLPSADETVIARLEKNLAEIPSVTDLLAADAAGTETLMRRVLDGLMPEVMETVETVYRCDCDRERVERAVFSLSSTELQEMADAGEPITVNCHFCDKVYHFTPAELAAAATRQNKK